MAFAYERPYLSISFTLATEEEYLTKFSNDIIISLRFDDFNFLSLISECKDLYLVNSNQHAVATNGPAHEPLPASSTPMFYLCYIDLSRYQNLSLILERKSLCSCNLGIFKILVYVLYLVDIQCSSQPSHAEGEPGKQKIYLLHATQQCS